MPMPAPPPLSARCIIRVTPNSMPASAQGDETFTKKIHDGESRRAESNVSVLSIEQSPGVSEGVRDPAEQVAGDVQALGQAHHERQPGGERQQLQHAAHHAGAWPCGKRAFSACRAASTSAAWSARATSRSKRSEEHT